MFTSTLFSLLSFLAISNASPLGVTVPSIATVVILGGTTTTVPTTTVVPTTTIVPTTIVTTTTAIASTTSAVKTFIVPSGWSAATVPCLADSGNRVLTGSSTSSSSMTIEKCLAFCDAGGFAIAGVEYSSECYCGNLLTNGGSLTKSATCNMPCSGDNTEICGGNYALSVFVSTKSNAPPADLVTPVKQVISTPSGWAAASSPCLADFSSRVLTGSSTASPSMTVEMCLAFCDSGGFAIGAVEYSTQCYCGNYLSNGGSLTKTATCNMPCGGNAQETCGGSFAMNVYVSTKANAPAANLQPSTFVPPAGYTAAGCISEPQGGRALPAFMTSSDTMTSATCISLCASKGFGVVGLEYGRECWCDVQLRNGASLTSGGTCNMPCSGAPNEICGGYNTLTLYTNPTMTSVQQISNGYNYQGCIQEVPGRALTGSVKTSDTMTVDTCTSYCKSGGFKFAGVEYGRECYCGNTFSNGASASAVSNQCNMACAAGSGICGGSNAIGLYVTA